MMSITFAGGIEPRNCALQIGYGFGYHNFVGKMDKVRRILFLFILFNPLILVIHCVFRTQKSSFYKTD